MSRQPPGRRADYRWFHAITTRWMDNDVFRHVNNVNYFSFFDTAVTYYELTSGAVDLLDGPVHCVVAEVGEALVPPAREFLMREGLVASSTQSPSLT